MTKVRQSKLELLRIIAMLMILMGHLFSMSGVANCTTGGNRFLWFLFGNGSRVAVNVFLMLGVWFMVDARFSGRRILTLYLHVLVWSIPITLLMLAIGYPVPTKEVFRGMMPFWGRGLWFASAYLVLLFWAPFLRKAFELPRKAQVLLLWTLFLFTCCVCTVPDPQLSYALDLYWFACMYLFIGFVKHQTEWVRHARPGLLIALGFSGYCAMATLNWYGTTHGGAVADAVRELSAQWLVDFKTVPNVLSAFAIFMGFVALKTGNRPLINACAANTFGVYVIHGIPSFWPFAAREICQVAAWRSCSDSWLYGLICAAAIFVACSLLDRVRARCISPLYLNSRWFNCLCSKLDGVYSAAGFL